jgi:hypothetical protein
MALARSAAAWGRIVSRAFPALLQRVALVRQDGQILLAHLADVGGGTRIAFDRTALIGQSALVGWQCFEPVCLRTEIGEDRLRPLRQVPRNLDNAFAERDPAPFGKLLLGLVVAGHIFAALAAQRADKL